MFFPLTHDDPSRFGGYRPVARLGGGGMGTVYLARAADGRTVALKTMHARLAADPVFRSRFRLETDAARIIGPVHGARVFDADPAADIPWLATEYVLGPGLDQAVSAHGAFPEPTVRALGALLCAALVQLHRSDVVHRDLKPSNIMLTVDGPKVIDFGIARADGDDHLTRAGAAAGTPAFMSPEQATGQEHTASGDVFALAGLLTYAATGRGPFGAGQPADLLYRVRYAEPDLTGVPPALVPVLARALGKAPADRPSAADLAAWLEPPGEASRSTCPAPCSPTSPGAPRRSSRRCRAARHPTTGKGSRTQWCGRPPGRPGAGSWPRAEPRCWLWRERGHGRGTTGRGRAG